MENTKYEYSHDNVGTRTTHEKDEHWYMQQLMTGAEAMRCCEIILKRWYMQTKNEELLWRWMYLSRDYALYDEWALAVDEMLDERNSNADPDFTIPTPPWLENTRLKSCKCCDKCKYKSSSAEATAGGE